MFGGGGLRLEVRVTVLKDDESVPTAQLRPEWPNLRNVAPTPSVTRVGADQ